MSAQPTLQTSRLRLRPFHEGDVSALVAMAGAREIADTTISVPHPFTPERAREWIARQEPGWEKGQEAHFAIVRREDDRLVGAIDVRDISREHLQAEVGFVIGVPWWGRGYAHEALGAVLDFAFGLLGLNRICAHHMVRNPASGRVLEKAGFRREGLLRQRVRKWGRFEDVVIRAVLRQDWEAASRVPRQLAVEEEPPGRLPGND